MTVEGKSVWETIKAFMDSKFIAMEPPYIPTPIEEFFAWFCFWLVEIANILGILLEAPVVAFLLWEFTKKNSRFRNSYFIILCYGFFVDLVCFSPFWMSKKINLGENFLKFGFGIAEWYSDFWYCFWNMILAFNRATAVWLPFQHTQLLLDDAYYKH
uniref:Uncharacterized protein n=1 Tax=Panagrolaimus davidi TaxID=227884 RepID=A0A914RDV0_9BILA